MAKRSAKPARKAPVKKSTHPLQKEVHPLTSMTVVFWGLIIILFAAIWAQGWLFF